MSEYIQVGFEFLSDELKEIAIALLSEIDYEGFEEEGDLLKGFVPATLFSEKKLTAITHKLDLSCSIKRVEEENWNALWESNFKPVTINHPIYNTPWVAVRASFHEPIKNAEHEIIITPKMSFGTGHHATTAMMMKMMSGLDFAGKTVLDFGTGTGILAILSEKLRASKIIAVDRDSESIRNATENVAFNHCTRIEIIKGSSADGNSQYDIILANIIKNVILGNLAAFAKQLVPGGILLLSGLIREDKDEILRSLAENKLIVDKEIKDENWICLQITH